MDYTKPSIRLKLVWVVWALLGLCFACKAYVQGGVSGAPVSFASALLRAQVNAHVYFLATIPVLYFAERFQLRRKNWHLHLLSHAIASIVFTVTVWATDTILHLWLYRPDGLGGVTLLRIGEAILEKFNEGMYVYWGTVLVIWAYASSQPLKGESGDSRPEPERPSEQMNALRAQSHFLFNTLNSIVVLLREDVEAAEAMLVSLSVFLRGMLSKEQEVSLGRELALLDSYLDLQGARFGSRLDAKASVEPEAAAALVPHLLLLSLARDAIEQSSIRSPEGKCLEVNARREGDWLILLVSADRDGEAAQESPTVKGTGLADARARLANLYGRAHRFDAKYSPAGGFLIDIRVPFRLPREGG